MSAHLVQESDSKSFQRRESLNESGILVVDKPEGLTSMDVIRVLRKVCNARKIGHGGTLDPFATGVLPILINKATGLSAKVMEGIKEYEGSLVLGVAYDTQDMTGTPLYDPKPVPLDVTMERLNELAKAFEGNIEQRPPMYSAVKKNGRPLYDYARAGETVEVETRKVFVERFRLTEKIDERTFKFYVRSAKGVYVRTLVHDLGEKLGIGAVVKSLTRTQAGRYHIDEAVQLSTLKFASDVRAHLKPLNAI
ncbi:MAG: tRNA pseudouridine(55) synthase TruB [Deltaproteobacteria bacterium]|nr:tRNA pseudouridine(55) synthase TruB [Deltaproteobacteria bacterium]